MKNSARTFLILPAVLPFALDVTLTLVGQPRAYWDGNYHVANEAAPVGLYLLEVHPFAFLGAALLYAVGFSLLIRFLPAGLALWVSLGFLVAHTSGSNSWLRYHPLLEPVNNAMSATLAAYCYWSYFVARKRTAAAVAGQGSEEHRRRLP